jgi:enhancing lycopene biosynthesis protein 2
VEQQDLHFLAMEARDAKQMVILVKMVAEVDPQPRAVVVEVAREAAHKVQDRMDKKYEEVMVDEALLFLI